MDSLGNWAGARFKTAKFGTGSKNIEGSLILFIVLI
jgi:hypothetical protein